jgi:lipoate-protein ligase A
VIIINPWRLIDTDLNHPFYVTAADEALAISCSEFNGKPTLHFYRRDPPGISVGYFRKVEEDVYIDKCKELGIEIVRRTSGGGSIFTDENQLIMGLITNQRVGKNVEETFKLVCTCLIQALGSMGINADYKPPNDILVNGKKISGSAQVKKKNVYIIHSTIILALDNEIINQLLKNTKFGYTSSIQHELGSKPDLGKLKIAVKDAFQDQLGVDFQEGTFNKKEVELIQQLIKNKYSTNAWNFKY